MDQHGHPVMARALAAEAEAYDLQLATAKLIGQGRAIARVSRGTRSQHKNTLALARESLATSLSLKEGVRRG